MQYIELSPVLHVNIITAPACLLANWCWYASPEIKEYTGIGNASRELRSNNTIALKQAC